MPRSITDHEIALIKRMLTMGMPNNRIQMYFNTMQRPVNSGRITGIKNETYSNSKSIKAATKQQVDDFIKAKQYGHSGKPIKPKDLSVPEIANLSLLLEGMVGHDKVHTGNYTVLPLYNRELEIIRHSLFIAQEAQEIPEWSHSTVSFLKGITAALEELKGTIEQTSETTKSAIIPLLGLLNKVLSKLQAVLEALKYEE